MARTRAEKGAWTEEEDILLKNCVEKYGERDWNLVSRRAGLNRCRKSCRLRWLNHLHPSLNRGPFTADEVDLINKLHRLLGNRWSLIAKRLPGRTANGIKKYWNTRLRKNITMAPAADDGNNIDNVTKRETITISPAVTRNHTRYEDNTNNRSYHKYSSYEIIKPKPLTLRKSWSWLERQPTSMLSSSSTLDPQKRQTGREDWRPTASADTKNRTRNENNTSSRSYYKYSSCEIIKPKPLTLTKSWSWSERRQTTSIMSSSLSTLDPQKRQMGREDRRPPSPPATVELSGASENENWSKQYLSVDEIEEIMNSIDCINNGSTGSFAAAAEGLGSGLVIQLSSSSKNAEVGSDVGLIMTLDDMDLCYNHMIIRAKAEAEDELSLDDNDFWRTAMI